MAYTKTPVNGADTFPANENDTYPLLETLALQNIKGVKSANRIEDGFYYEDLTEKNGVVLEYALINKAKCQTFDKTQCDRSPLDPEVIARYFNNWNKCRYQTTVRRDDIRKIIANKGTGVEDVVAEILDSLTQGKDGDEFKNGRNLLLNTQVTDYAPYLSGTPANLRGILYVIRDMYDALRTENMGLDLTGWETVTPERDIRIAISFKLLNLIDVVELANLFNLSKVELIGKLVVIPVSDLDKSNWYKVVVYDRKAFIHARRELSMDNEKCAGAQYWNYYLFVDDLWAYNPLFKAVSMDFSVPATAELNTIITPTPSEPSTK